MSASASEMRALLHEAQVLGHIDARSITDEQDDDIGRRLQDIEARLAILRGLRPESVWRALSDEQRVQLASSLHKPRLPWLYEATFLALIGVLLSLPPVLMVLVPLCGALCHRIYINRSASQARSSRLREP